MTKIPQFMPILSHGSHNSPEEGACIMEMASFLSDEEWTDLPACTHRIVAEAAQWTNDNMNDEERQRLLPLLSRLMNTRKGEDDFEVALGLVVWVIKQIPDSSLTAYGMTIRDLIVDWDKTGKTSAKKLDFNLLSSSMDEMSIKYAVLMITSQEFPEGFNTHAGIVVTSGFAALYRNGSDPYELLTGLLDEYDRLTGRTEYTEVTTDDLKRIHDLLNA